MTMSELLPIVITVVVAIWGIYQTRITDKLQREVQLLTVGLDQSIQLLHRARNAADGLHRAYVYMSMYLKNGGDADEKYLDRWSEHSAYWAELRGLAFAIGDQDLLDLVNHGYGVKAGSHGGDAVVAEMEMRNQTQRVHTRIAQLLALSTKPHPKQKRRWFSRSA